MDKVYINKGKLIEEIYRAASRSVVGETDEPYLDWKTVVSFIFDAPEEAVELVRSGNWIERVEKLRWCEDDVEVYYDCSCCGTHNFAETLYCPNCGAKMNIKEIQE